MYTKADTDKRTKPIRIYTNEMQQRKIFMVQKHFQCSASQAGVIAMEHLFQSIFGEDDSAKVRPNLKNPAVWK